MKINQNNIIKILSCSLDVDFETKTANNLIHLIELSRSIESIKSRYANILKSENKEGNNTETILFFEAKIENYYTLTQNDLQKYCDFKKIDLKDKNIREYSVNERAREWKTDVIRNEILNKIDCAKPSTILNIVLIPKSKSEVFYREFKNQNHIDWDWKDLSSQTNFNWTPDVLEDGKELWDWKILCKNNSVKWNQADIKKFDKYFDYKALSENSVFDWDEIFIIENKEKLFLHSLIENRAIVWTSKLINIFLTEIDFTHLSKKGNLSKSAIIEWSEQWKKTVNQTHYSRRNSDGSYYYFTTHTLWEYLCENKNVIWTEDILTQFLEFLPLKNLCDKRIEVSTKFINDNWSFYKNELISYRENYDGDASKTYQDVYLIEKLKDCKIIDLTLETFLENELRWWGVFCSEDFLNHTIKKIITAPNS